MLAALDAAEAAGGDIRGKQSAAIKIVRGTSTGKPWADTVFDLRVEDNPAPLVELRRLVTLQRAYNFMNDGDLATEKKDAKGALAAYSKAEALVPGNAEMIFWHAVARVNLGQLDAALPLFRRCFAIDPSWAELVTRLPAAGQLTSDPKTLEKIAAQRPKR